MLARGLAHRGPDGRAVRIVGSISDITARKRAEEQLKAERDFSRGLIDSLPAPFFLFDEHGRLVLWNRFVSELTGLDDAQLQNAEAGRLVIAEQEAVLAHRIESALGTGEASVEVMLRRDHAEPVPFLVVGRRVLLDGKPHIVGVGTDLTERKFAEKAIKRLNLELERRVLGVGADDEHARLHDLFSTHDARAVATRLLHRGIVIGASGERQCRDGYERGNRVTNLH